MPHDIPAIPTDTGLFFPSPPPIALAFPLAAGVSLQHHIHFIYHPHPATMASPPVAKKARLSLPQLEEGEKWDAFHKDPTNDITLKSLDGICFQVSSYRLGEIRYVSYMFTGKKEIWPPCSPGQYGFRRHVQL